MIVVDVTLRPVGREDLQGTGQKERNRGGKGPLGLHSGQVDVNHGSSLLKDYENSQA